ncbi:MAG: YihY/virulence factor BrkB family protein [Puniceicoccaceae bacterium]|nr:MAG: YihY/virulence factor BrkB family protein [Puniceicoccaceae bacterium]
MTDLQARFRQRWHHLGTLLRTTIWQPEHFDDRSARGWLFAVFRVISICLSGLQENKLTNRAAALSYSSLLGVGPLVALIVLLSGFLLERTDPDDIINAATRGLYFIAPQLEELQQILREEDPETTSPLGTLLNTFVEGSRSAAVGLVGIAALVIIAIQLFTSIEQSFNAVWGVRRGRSWQARILLYWTLMSLGALLAIAVATMVSALTLGALVETLPWASGLVRMAAMLGPVLSFGLLVLLLAVFYRFIPNIRVDWGAAMVGSVVTALLLNLNNYLAFLYFRRVVISQSLYGSLGIVPVLMIGLFVFWLIVLLGGQLIYAIQNAGHRSGQAAWQELNHATREALSLLVLIQIARRFFKAEPPLGADELAAIVRVPSQVLNESINRLIDIGLVSKIPAADNRSGSNDRYQPARPLDKIGLLDFKRRFDRFGENPDDSLMDSADPLVAAFHARLTRAEGSALADQTLDDWLREETASKAKSS